MAAYQVRLPVFEGPFDLLFHLIEEQKLNLYDIPIATITSQYLDYLHVMEILDMDIASEFLVMAATLLEIKSKMLLPKVVPVSGDYDGENREEYLEGLPDAREDLVARLLEYKKFKLIALELRELERKSSRIFTRGLDYEMQPLEILQISVTVNDLLCLYQGLVRRRMNPPLHRVVINQENLSDRINEIRVWLKAAKGKIEFTNLLKNNDRYELVLSFMAVLELSRAGELSLIQDENFQPIYLKRNRIENAINPSFPPNALTETGEQYEQHAG
ncbi:MAG: segregation/condensation protein A [Candidatus Riflebacteria bacterium]|nr:segregation/condensation protein A [Candidatus Riflebacteria bacterium]